MIYILIFLSILFCQDYVIQTTHNREIISYDVTNDLFLTSSIDGETKIWSKNSKLQIQSISYNNQYDLIKTYFLDNENIISFYGNGQIIITDIYKNLSKKIQLEVINIKYATINNNNKIFIYDGEIIKVYDLVDLNNNNLKSIKIDNLENINKLISKDEGVYLLQENKISFINEIGKINIKAEIKSEYDELTLFDEYILIKNDNKVEIFYFEENNIKKVKEIDDVELFFSDEDNIYLISNSEIAIYDENIRIKEKIKTQYEEGIRNIIGQSNNNIIIELNNKSICFQDIDSNNYSIIKDEYINSFYHIEYDDLNKNLLLYSEYKLHNFNFIENKLTSEEIKYNDVINEYLNDKNVVIKKYYDNILIHNLFNLNLIDLNNNYTYENILSYNVSNDKLILVYFDKIEIYDFTTKDLIKEVELMKKFTRNDIVTTPILIRDKLYYVFNNKLVIYDLTLNSYKTEDIPSKSQCVSITNINKDIVVFLYHNGEVQFYNTKSDDYFLRFILFKENQWVAIGNNNNYNGSKNSINKIAFIKASTGNTNDNIIESKIDNNIFNFIK